MRELYKISMKKTSISKKQKKEFIKAILLFCIFLFPILTRLITSSYRYIIQIGIFILIYIIAVSGLDILYGYCGQISMGHAGFFAIGAYGSAIISDYLKLPILLSILTSSIISCVIAFFVAYPSTKLKFHFLSLATIAFGEIVYSFIQASPNEITGNFRGYFPKPICIFGINLSSNYIACFYFILVILIIMLLMKQNIVKSKFGRGFIAIKENSTAANGMGINIRKYKILAFCLSAIYVSISGSLYAHFVNYISPGLFSYDQSVAFMTMLLFGGSGTFFGPVVGVFTIQIINEFLRYFDKYQTLFYGVLLLVVVLFMPNGLVNVRKKKVGQKN